MTPESTEHATGADGSETASWEGDVLTLTSRLRILRRHAQGGLGEVSLARDEALGRRVALKHIQDRWASHPQSRARFLVEAEITGGLDHPFIVPIHGLGSDRDKQPFYAMRFIEGETLRDAVLTFHRNLKHRRPQGAELVAFRELLGRFVHVCQATHYAHDRGVIHRDLKPSNVMLGKHGETLVVDWGLAKVIGRDEAVPAGGEPTVQPSSGSDVQATKTGVLVGTLGFMAPEQAEGRVHDLGRRCDVYALGATLYYVLTARAPVDAGDVADKVRQVTTGAILPVRRAAKPEGLAIKLEVPRPLEAICRKAMALKPEDRYSSALVLAEEMKQILSGEPVTAYRENLGERSRRWMRCHRTLVSSAAALLVAGLLGVSSFALVLGDKNRELAKSYAATKEAETEANKQLDRAMASIKDYFTGFSEEALTGKQVPKALWERLLAKPVQFYEELTRELSSKKERRPARASPARRRTV